MPSEAELSVGAVAFRPRCTQPLKHLCFEDDRALANGKWWFENRLRWSRELLMYVGPQDLHMEPS
eukprot:5242211-Alexandrium_andersonii.AAC.1